MNDTNVKLDKLGRLLIPAVVRRKLGINSNSRLILRVRDSRLELLTSATAVSKAQQLVRKHVEAKAELADELIRSRRRESSHD